MIEPSGADCKYYLLDANFCTTIEMFRRFIGKENCISLFEIIDLCDFKSIKFVSYFVLDIIYY